MDNKRYLHGGLTFKIDKADNDTLIATITRRDHKRNEDSAGALYYVVVVILIYGCSILMMIASYIRKNKVDQRLNRYFKDMATVRKREEQLQLFNAATIAAALHANQTTDLTPSPRSSHEDERQPPFPRRNRGIGMKLLPGTPQSQTRLVLPRNKARRVQSPGLRSQRNSVRFSNDQSDVDSDNDNVFLSPAPDRKIRSPSSPKYLSPISSPLLSPHKYTLTKSQPDDSDNDIRSHLSSSVTDVDQFDHSNDTEQSPLVLRTPHLQGVAHDHSQKGYQVVSTV
ncbi:hypothetical protein CAPTEDRAFT_202676 [Capitella teleta]|uniref:Uncharacterized protein n=1 Tax=Capitella teleta TaxID=283909 RepID=R7TPB1_CAPTE|nr:hypothetical protein CAPTEDRAFT_202676 [Capitella teleta]|eukprot:ELT93331.1 hypothetical protein CAPTEDRAFT_202676 [Capitella teleta]